MSDVTSRPAGPTLDWHPEPQLLSIRDEAASREALREAGAAVWETALDYLYDHAFVRAMGTPIDYDALRREFFGPTAQPDAAPRDPSQLSEVLREFSERVAPHTVSAYHPRSFGYFTPPPLLASVAGEVLSQVAQQGIDIWHAGPIGAFVEEEVIRWLCDLVGYRETGGATPFGILTSGGVMANFIAMALVRDVHVPVLRGEATPPRGRALEGLRIYTSDQTHFSIGRALDELGFPPETLVVLPSDGQFRLRGTTVEAAVDADLERGTRPVAIAAVAGATNTGSVDAIGELADVAAKMGMWLHVDAAYGAAARLSQRDAGRVGDLHRADSVTVDPHKWLFQAYDIGGLVVRDGSVLAQAFGGRRPEYYRAGHGPGGGGNGSTPAAAASPAAAMHADAATADTAPADDDGHGSTDQLNFWRLGFEGTRRWRALKLWMSWHHLGTEGLGRLVERTSDMAAYLHGAVVAARDLEEAHAPELGVVCFRHLAPGLAGDALDRHQDRLQAALEADGDGWLSTTRLRGATWLRAGVMNPMTSETDIDRLLADLRRLAAEVSSGDG